MVEVGFKSDKGLKRKNNEDAFFVMPEENIFIIADGVGGNNSGEVASRTTISKIVAYIRNNALDKDAAESVVERYFTDCIEKVNKNIYDLAMLRPENMGMATTVTMAYLTGNSIYVVNVGDSRAYIFRYGELTQITDDHTYVNELIKEGAITREEARYHEKKNIITKAIGGEALTSPDFFRVEAEQGDIIVLCTDGLHGEIGDDNMRGIIAGGKTMQETCASLVNRANQFGGHDNITVICLKIQGGYGE